MYKHIYIYVYACMVPVSSHFHTTFKNFSSTLRLVILPVPAIKCGLRWLAEAEADTDVASATESDRGRR